MFALNLWRIYFNLTPKFLRAEFIREVCWNGTIYNQDVAIVCRFGQNWGLVCCHARESQLCTPVFDPWSTGANQQCMVHWLWRASRLMMVSCTWLTTCCSTLPTSFRCGSEIHAVLRELVTFCPVLVSALHHERLHYDRLHRFKMCVWYFYCIYFKYWSVETVQQY